VPVREGTVFGDPLTSGNLSQVVVNQAFVDQWFAGESPVGRRITYSREPGADAQWNVIVGVVGNERMELEVDPLPEVIEHLATDPPQRMHVVVRHDGGASALSASLRAAVGAVEPEAPVGRIRTMRDVAIDALAADRYVISVLGAFAVVALVLASVGVYGVASQAARLRTQEVGIRIAIGASAWSVGRTLVARGMTFIVAGVAIGSVATLATGGLLRAQLFRVEPTDQLTLAAVALLLLAVAFIAIAIPARRAVKIDPVRVLRGEQV
jgi:hypothetical protein